MANNVEESFATVEELQTVWPALPVESEKLAEALLLDASQFLVDMYPREVESAAPATLRRIVCSMVRRIMQVPDELLGMNTIQQGAGPYQATMSASNPHGDFYLTKQEQRSLGVIGARGFEVDLLEGSRRAHDEYRPRLLGVVDDNW
jgi:hypothetical protein